jgi:hypothetical protein
MKGRVYDPTLARFLTPDPFVSDPSATQPWNPYAYVRNNPLRYTDPSGFEECAGCEEFWNAGEAFWEGGTGGLNAYSHGALDREVERFVNKYYDVRRDSGLWGDARKAEADARKAQLKQYDEQRIRRSGDVEPPEALAAPEVPTLTMPGLDSGLSPGVDPKIQAICEAQPWACAADEVTVKGHNPGSVTASWEYDHPEWVREIDAAVQGFCRFISSLSCQDWAGDTPMPFSIGGPAEGVRSGIPLLTRATPRIEISEAVASKIASRLGVQAWEAKLLVKAISTGHAFRKHAAEFGVATEDQLAQKVSNAMANGRMQKLASDRVGFAGHDGTAVILNPHGADAGTAVYRGTAQRAWDFIRGK